MPTATKILDETRVIELAQEAAKTVMRGKYRPSPEAMKEALSKLPEQTERAYEKQVVNYAVKWDDEVMSKEILELIGLIKKADVTEEEKKIAFAAFCVLENYARRSENLSDFQSTMRTYRKYFLAEPFLLHLDLLSDIKSLESFNAVDWTPKKLNDVLEKARKNMLTLTGNIGSDHAFVETVVLAFENAADMVTSIANMDTETLLKEALSTIIGAENGDPNYAKFHCTHGRLLAIMGDYDNAVVHINMAIDKEDSTKSDYSIRVGRYLAYIQQVRAAQLKNELEAITSCLETNSKNIEAKVDTASQTLDKKMEDVSASFEAQTKESTTKSMEFLGLFSGIVSFTIGSLTITGAIAEQSIKHAAGLIVILMGALIGVYSCFGIILHGALSKKAVRNIVVLALGLGIVLGGIWLCSH